MKKWTYYFYIHHCKYGKSLKDTFFTMPIPDFIQDLKDVKPIAKAIVEKE